MRNGRHVLMGIILVLLFSCDPSPEVERPDINASVSIEVPDTATQTMIPEKYDYYVGIKDQIQQDYYDEYDVLYDQWQRNIISTSEFQTALAALNEENQEKNDDIDYKRLTEAWWQPLKMEITIDNSSDSTFKYVDLYFTITYHDGRSEELLVDCPDIYPLGRRDEEIILDTNYLIKTYAYSEAEYILSE